MRPVNGIFFTGKMLFSAVAEVALLEHTLMQSGLVTTEPKKLVSTEPEMLIWSSAAHPTVLILGRL